MSELYGVTFTVSIIGISLFVIGFFIKKTKSAELISGYESEKDYDSKDLIAEFFGNGMMLMGLISIILTIVYFFITRSIVSNVKRNSVILISIVVINIVLISAKLYYMLENNRKNVGQKSREKS